MQIKRFSARQMRELDTKLKFYLLLKNLQNPQKLTTIFSNIAADKSVCWECLNSQKVWIFEEKCSFLDARPVLEIVCLIASVCQIHIMSFRA